MGEPVRVERRGKASHRSDLRGELLAAAQAFVAEHGHEGLSLRKLAQEVGVSSGAPYHHFPDRRSLLLAVALDGYERLRETAKHCPAGGYEGLYQVCTDFLRFAASNSRLFTLMYESELVRPILDPAVGRAQNGGFLELRDRVRRANPHLKGAELSIQVATLWATLFGFALQRERSMLQSPSGEPKPDELGEDILRNSLRLITGTGVAA